MTCMLDDCWNCPIHFIRRPDKTSKNIIILIIKYLFFIYVIYENNFRKPLLFVLTIVKIHRINVILHHNKLTSINSMINISYEKGNSLIDFIENRLYTRIYEIGRASCREEVDS